VIAVSGLGFDVFKQKSISLLLQINFSLFLELSLCVALKDNTWGFCITLSI
jgi:hypothetical protein